MLSTPVCAHAHDLFVCLFACLLVSLFGNSWRAAEHLCQFAVDHPEFFRGRRICELGAGLGLVAVLLEKLGYCSSSDHDQDPSDSAGGGGGGGNGSGSSNSVEGWLVATDGDEATLELLRQNKADNCCSFGTEFLYWGQCGAFLRRNCCTNDSNSSSSSSNGSSGSGSSSAAATSAFAASDAAKFDLVVAADVIYEETQVEPLLDTVTQIMKRKYQGGGGGGGACSPT